MPAPACVPARRWLRLAKQKGLSIHAVEALRERGMTVALFTGNFDEYMQAQWSDLNYAAEGCESLLAVQKRNIEACLSNRHGAAAADGSSGCAWLHFINHLALRYRLRLKGLFVDEAVCSLQHALGLQKCCNAELTEITF
ncbi:MAG: hypothetical protein LLG09_03615 [Negativicutes bacterium]|nr:hypothetical protein [Negativicutes bacterium]